MKFENLKFYNYCRVGTEEQLYSNNEQEELNQEQVKIEVAKNEQS